MSSRRIVLAGLAAAWLAAAPGNMRLAASPHDWDDRRIGMTEDRVVLEFVGQVTNFSASLAHPLGTSNQYGYLPLVRGIDATFSANPQDETTALFTFFTDVVTTRIVNNGPVRIINREGTTTIYRSLAPASFVTPDSFRAGTPIQSSEIRQQVIIDTLTGVFTVVNENTIESVQEFPVAGHDYRLGKRGERFRTTLAGHLNSPAPPSGYFGGFAVGVDERRSEGK